MLRRKFCQLLVLVVCAASALALLPAVASADTISNGLGANATVRVPANNSVTANYRLLRANHDGVKGCNASPKNPAVMTIIVSPEVSVTPASKQLTFTNCRQVQSATFTASHQGGPYTVTVAVTPNGPGSYNTALATFTLLILPPPDPDAPLVTVHFPSPGASGWFLTRPVMGTVTATDPSTVANIDCVGAALTNVAGLNTAAASADLVVNAEGPTYVTCQATDNASPPHTGIAPGSTYAADLLIDTVPPAVTPDYDRDPDSNGWYNHGVTVSFLGDDDSSGVDTCTDPVLYAGPDQASATLWGTCSDLAGNAAPQTAALFKYDATPPTHVAGAADRPADFLGGYRHAVTITFAGADATSGAAPGSLNCTKVTYTGPASQQITVSGSCTDPAGNTSAAASFSFKFFASLFQPYLHR